MSDFNCESCGMPMDEERIYCEHCGDGEGKELKISKEQAIEGVKKNYFMDKMGLSEEAAQKEAENFIDRQPAWQEGV